MRVPTIAWWPGRIPPGVETEAIATTVDIFPSFARLVGGQVPTDRVIDGKDVLDVLLGKPGATSPHKTHYYEVDGIRRASGNWLAESAGNPSCLTSTGIPGKRTTWRRAIRTGWLNSGPR